MLGLDAGWNCHISLGNDPIAILSDPQLEEETKINSPHRESFKKPKKKLKQNFKSTYRRRRSNLINKKKIFTSLPDLKFSKYRLNSDQESLNGLSSQIVKFDLSNLNENKLENGVVFRCKNLKRLNSTGSYISVNSNDMHQRCAVVPGQLTNMNSSSKSNSLKTTLSKIFNPKNIITSSSSKVQEDENSSHFTAHSSRTLSETDILGNAVNY